MFILYKSNNRYWRRFFEANHTKTKIAGALSKQNQYTLGKALIGAKTILKQILMHAALNSGYVSVSLWSLCVSLSVYLSLFLSRSLVISSRLNWNDPIKTVCSKVSKSTGIFLHRTRKKLNADTLLLLYQTLIQPYFDYCNIIWSVGKSVFLEKLFVKQKGNTCNYIC